MKRNNFLNLAKAKEEAEAKRVAKAVAEEKNTIRNKFFKSNIGTNIDFDSNDSNDTSFHATNKYYITNDTIIGTTSSTRYRTANDINLSDWNDKL
jgi:hypothetical protein